MCLSFLRLVNPAFGIGLAVFANSLCLASSDLYNEGFFVSYMYESNGIISQQLVRYFNGRIPD